MTEHGTESEGEEASVGAQLERAVRDLWSMLVESGENYVVFLDHRGLSTRVEQGADGKFYVAWEGPDETWIPYTGSFDNPREAAFHAFQGPH